MIEIQQLEPHDPFPESLPPKVVVFRRFDEDDPRLTITDITLTGLPGKAEIARPSQADGSPMSLDAVIDAACKVAESEGIGVVFVLDRTMGPLEHDVLDHQGDHGFGGVPLSDTNLEDTNTDDTDRGPDMRDRKP